MNTFTGYLIDAVRQSIIGLLTLSIIIFSETPPPAWLGLLVAVLIITVSRATTTFIYLYLFRKTSHRTPKTIAIVIYESINFIAMATAIFVGASVANENIKFA